ncbi:MAG: hypothetical protein JWP22_1329 [Ramlibacter sp.]|nr:hypothetical protein [Ramlibacter sp.]
MNTQLRSISLQSGEAMAVDRQACAMRYLVEGEVLVQACAEWLGDTVVVPPARRIAAPAVLPGDSQAIVAIGAVRIAVACPVRPLEQLMTAWGAALSRRLRLLRLARP